VFHAAGNHLIARAQESLNRQIEGFGTVFGKNETLRIIDVKQARQILTAVFDDIGCFLAALEAPPSLAGPIWRR
jgi:hypothetical protein